MRPYFSRRAFSLMEMAIVLAVSGLMFSFVLSTVQGSGKLAVNCVQETKQQLQDIRGAVERFARKNDRLPLPAARNIGSDHVQFGRESSGADIDAAGGVSFGALPWQALGLTAEHAGDCWGQKYTYAVTTALTTDASSGGFKDSTVLGNITLKKDATNDVNTEMAYAIISHGEDGLGAVKLNWAADNPDHGWCSGATDIGYTNCLATGATLVDAIYNNGKDAGTNYFDDLIVAAGKPQTVQSGPPFMYAWGSNMSSLDYYATPQKVDTTQTFSSLFIDGDYACGLTAAGAAYCWGSNTYRQLGDGTTTDRTAPTPVSGGLTFATISLGSTHVCGLTPAGAAYCWGSNTYGQLGDGTILPSATPIPVTGGLTFTTLKTFSYTNCGLTAAGVAYCWGDNAYGQLGDGTGVTNRRTPTLVAGGLTFAQISEGFNTMCGVTAAGAAYCWGRNDYGQVGNNTTTNANTPTLVSGGLTFSTVSGGRNHTCGITTAGATYCWGHNSGWYQLGDGTSTDRHVPTPVSGGFTFSSISGGYGSTCALTTAGVAYCWGYNIGYQLGNGTATNYTAPTAPVVGGRTFTSITAGVTKYNTCALTTAGAAYCWGENILGALGRGSKTYYSNAPKAISTVGLNFSKTYASNTVSCGLTELGTAYCWGSDTAGKLGDGGAAVNQFSPVAVSGGLAFDTLALSAAHTCGLTTAGAAYCWGSNGGVGLLGNGGGASSFSPAAVSGGLTFTKIATGTSHTCALTAAGAAYCWGTNGNSQLGDGGTSARTTPNPVSGGLAFSSIAGGYQHTCALTTAGAAYCWGENGNNQLGNGGTLDSTTPTPTSGGLTFSSLSAGYQHTCALTAAGVAYCWGENGNNQLGDGTTTDRSAPTLVSGGLLFSSLSAGYQHTCGMTTGNAVYCWGNNASGQLGDASNTTRSTPTLISISTGLTPVANSLYCRDDTCAVLLSDSESCTDLWTAGGSLGRGFEHYAYQSAAPVGACVPEYRTCTASAWTGSYAQQSCTPGCDSRAISWTVGATTCTATMPAQAGGASIAVPATAGGTGSVTASCSTTGIVTLSGGSCV